MKFKKPMIKNPQKLEQLHKLHLQAYNQGNFKVAFEYAVQGHKLAPNLIEPLDDAIVSAMYANMWNEVVIYAKKILHRDPNNINAMHGLAHAYDHLGEVESCRIQGLRALQMLDEQVLQHSELPKLSKLEIKAGKKIISFSLFGDNPKYVESAVINAEITPKIYPDWICRFYIDNTVPQSAVQKLRNLGSEVVMLDESYHHIPKTMWRFLALDDKDVSHVIFRDADSVISYRESQVVSEWLDSGKYFHTIRDFGSHTELILAGLWGAVTGVLPNIKEMMNEYVKKNKLDPRFADQYFLRQYVWRYARQSLCAHDSVFGFLNAKPFPTIKREEFSVGDTEATHSFEATWDGIVEGASVKWQLFSRINPLLAEDLSYQLFDEERLICEYETVVVNGKIQALIPKRYYQGFKTGESRVAVNI